MVSISGSQSPEPSRVPRALRVLVVPQLIAISGQYNQGADKILAQMTGFKYYLSKPCDPNVLLAFLATLASSN